MTSIPLYPLFAPITIEMAKEITPQLVKLPDGVSEYTFAGFYLFRNSYNYKVSLKDDLLIISGEKHGKSFFITPCCMTSMETIDELFLTHDMWKLISPNFIKKNSAEFEKAGYIPEPDRNNFDYVYLRSDLATLSGKKFHKKRNHVNSFELTYPIYSSKALDISTREDAREVLEHWASLQEHPDTTDYRAAVEALDLLEHFDMNGLVLYVDSVPVAWTLAETVAAGTMAVVHFEKARIDYRGAYQFINYLFAQKLPESIVLINREQDLGDLGLRQSKMTYRPSGFVEKFVLNKASL
ncbi:MAG TPA: phosphatidylglycerol lysyltransferase domain-containing protein [Treponemataceae bacterium]|nr:phosphatidylglycerol lysyltransferase domain-containing protein [Treponemataceae bacterium]